MPEIYIFRAGKYPQGNWPMERVRKMVDAYDPEEDYEAPAVIGHWKLPTDEGQYAHGWVRSLRMDSDGKVYATIPEFSAEARSAIEAGKLRYVSAEIYEFDRDDAEKPPYLRAVALLGRDTPQIAGTRLDRFGMCLGATIHEADEEKRLSTFTRKVKAREMNALLSLDGHGLLRNEQREDYMKTLEDVRREYEESQAQVARFRKENDELRVAAAQRDAETFYGKLRDEGKITPGCFEKVVKVDAEISDETRETLRALFTQLEPKVDFSGKHVADKKTAPTANAGEASLASLAARIRAYQKTHGIATFAAAAEALYEENPDLFDGGENA